MTIKILRVGDPHVKINNLEESQKLIDFVIKTAQEEKVAHIEILGDLMHLHAVKRVEVEDFWYRNLLAMCKMFKVIALVGNHDMANSGDKKIILHGLKPFELIENLTIVEKPINIKVGNGVITYAPYMKDNQAFLTQVNKLHKGSKKLLVAHQTFTGAQYDNGFYAPDGIEPELVMHEGIISGHVHGTSIIGKCLYVGTPKWDTMADANKSKGIWIFEHADDMSLTDSKFISTAEIVTPITKTVLFEGEAEPELDQKARNYIEFRGKTEWINKMKKKYKGIAQIKAVPVDRKISSNSVGEKYDISQFLDKNFQPIAGVSKLNIKGYLEVLSGSQNS